MSQPEIVYVVQNFARFGSRYYWPGQRLEMTRAEAHDFLGRLAAAEAHAFPIPSPAPDVSGEA